MIDFLKVKNVSIPNGLVESISYFDKVLWLKSKKLYNEELNYLQSTGTQYIDTEYIPNGNTSIEMLASGISASSFALSTGGTWFLGGRQGYLNKAFGFYYNPSLQNLYYAFGNNMPYSTYSSSLMYGNNKKFYADKTGLYINDNKIIPATATTFTSPVSLFLFVLNNNGAPTSYTSYKMHYCKIYDNGKLVRDYIPVLDLNNIPCMYDKVSKKFFYNKGTGRFIAGKKIQPIEYLESTGTQYIDTEIIPSSNTDVDIRCNYTLDKHGHTIICGGNGYGNNELIIAPNLKSSTSIITSKGNSTQIRVANASNYVNQTHRYRIIGWNFYFDNDIVGTFPTANLSTNNSMYLMAYHRNAGVGEYFIGKFYYAKIYENGVLVRDFIPVVDENDVACMYDKVSETCFYNQGTGSFIAGRKIHPLNYLESNGEGQYIDTQIPSKTPIYSEFYASCVNNVAIGFGAYGSGSNAYQFGVVTNLHIKAGSVGYTSMPYDKEKHYWKVLKDGVYIDDTRYGNSPNASWYNNQNELNYILFGKTLYNKTYDLYIFRIYGLKIWDYENNLIRDYIPAIDENGVPFMFDQVTNTIFENNGDGEFLYD